MYPPRQLTILCLRVNKPMPTIRNTTRLFATALLLTILFHVPAAAQTPFLISAQDAQGVVTIGSGASLTMAATAVGQPVSILINLTYTGTTSAQIASVGLVGATQFSVISGPPPTLIPGQSMSFTVRYQPDSSRRLSAQVSVTYDETQAAPALPRRSVIPLNFVGVAPEFFVYYVLSSDQNSVPLPNGGTLTFPPAVVNTTTTTATIAIGNSGSGPGIVNSASAAPSAFQILGLPLLPGVLAAGGEVRFTLRFAPLAIGPQSGTLQIVTGDNTLTAALQGLAVGSTFSYEILRDGAVESIQPDQEIVLPDRPVGEPASLLFRVRNIGNSDGQIAAIDASGGFLLPDRPLVPLVLAPNAAVTFTITFTPGVAQRITGQLRIGADRFPLAVTGLGSQLRYSYLASGEAIVVEPAGTVVFSPARIGSSSETSFAIQNRGTRTAVITSISVATDTRNTFRIVTSPSLPLRLEPGARSEFPIQFSPSETGTLTATLRIDTSAFTLSGAASLPPPPSGFRFEGASGVLEPLTQPGLSLTLNERYPVNLTGVLTLAFFSDTFATDPALQFSSGGRTATFVIPAGETRARFGGGATELRFQSGTVEGEIAVTASFATSGGAAVSPENAPVLRMSVARRAPRLLSIQTSALTTTTATLAIVGFATTRSLRDLQLSFELVASPSVTVPQTSFTVNLETLADSWFRSTTSLTTGGQFSITIPFTLQPSVTGATLPAFNTIFRSVSATSANAAGSSNTVTYTF